jgi:hypothetical protein
MTDVILYDSNLNAVGTIGPGEATVTTGDDGIVTMVVKNAEHWLAKAIFDRAAREVIPVTVSAPSGRWHGRIDSASVTLSGLHARITRNHIGALFDVDRWREFNTDGSARQSHEQPVPIWAGYIIEMLGVVMTAQEHLNADVAQLIAANTAFVGLVRAQAAEIESLKAAAPAALDFTALDAVTAQLSQAASAVPSAPAADPVPDASGTAPVTSEPVDPTVPDETVTVPAVDASLTVPVTSEPIDATVPATADQAAAPAPVDSSTPIADAVAADEAAGSSS